VADDSLLQAAEAVAEGHECPNPRLGPADSAVLEQLRIIAKIGALYGRSDPPTLDLPLTEWRHLRLEEPVGRGSSGRVFRAYDAKLDRHVAVKLLRDEDGQEAPITEARLLARVRHANVVTVYDADRDGGLTGIWMEFIDGRTLHDIVATDGPRGASELIDTGIAVSSALSAVHAAGLLHRDVKARNVMRERGGRVVLMDLGAGLAVDDDRDASRTGTLPYVAPEVLAGAAASVRSEVYSLGVLMFFLATGRYPFTGSTARVLRQEHAARRRRHLADLRQDLPMVLVAAIERAMALEPDERFQSVGEFMHALERSRPHGQHSKRRVRQVVAGAIAACAIAALIGGFLIVRRADAPVRPRVSSVTVLPFKVSTPVVSDSLAEGLADSIVADLSRLPGLTVISFATSRQLGSTAESNRVRSLHVDAMIDGSASLDGETLRIEARVVQVASESSLAVVQRHGGLEELPALRRSLTDGIAEALGYPRPRSPAHVLPAAVYQTFLEARSHWYKRTPEALLEARDLFQRVVDGAPGAAVAHAALGQAYLLLGAFDVLPKSDMYPRAEAEAHRALEIDAAEASAHATLGYLLHVRGDMLASGREFRRAIEIDPNDSTARQWYALTLVGRKGAEAEGLRQMEIAFRLDPLSKAISVDLGVAYARLGRYDDAARHLEATAVVFPTFAGAYAQLAAVREAQGRHADAAKAMRRAIDLGQRTADNLASLGFYLARIGDREAARALLFEVQEMAGTAGPGLLHSATIHAALGDDAQAIRLMRQARRSAHASDIDAFLDTSLRRFPDLWKNRDFVAAAAPAKAPHVHD
jgi:tetratricopeptide (TPR) repeat protein